MATQDWANALQIKPGDLAAWKLDAPKGASLIFWCLQTNRIDSSTYLEWAKNHYGLLCLRSDYFAQDPDHTLWQGIKSVANWSPAMVPVANWDGVVFVACVEPPADVQWSFPVTYVLASAADLEGYWQKLTAPAATSLPTDSTITQPPTEVTTPLDFEAPAGFNLSEKPVMPVLDLSQAAPEGLSGFTDIKIAEELPPTPDSVEASGVTNFDVPEGLSSTTGVMPVLNFNLPQPPLVPVATPKLEAFPPEPLATPQHTQSASAPEGSDFTEITRIASSLDFLKQDFESSMILVARDGGLKPLIWDSSWKAISEPVGPKNLTDPSAFRIVLRTKNAYLGHIVDTPVNREFFEAWNVKSLPEKVLIQPIIDKDTNEVVGVFLSICGAALRNPAILNAGERHSAEILRLMKDAYVARSFAA